MVIKQVNLIINITSKILYLLIIIYLAVFTAKIVWWIFTPIISDIYVEKSNIDSHNLNYKFIINRAPFGAVITPTAQAKPTIVDKMRLTGIYDANHDSIIFYQIDNTSHIAKIGDSVDKNIVIKTILADSVILFDGKHDIEIFLTHGNIIENSNDNDKNNNKYGDLMKNREEIERFIKQK